MYISLILCIFIITHVNYYSVSCMYTLNCFNSEDKSPVESNNILHNSLTKIIIVPVKLFFIVLQTNYILL